MIKDLFSQVKDQIEKARKTVVGSADMIKLVAVSKQQPDDKITEALATGHRLFGENRVQEATMRWQARKNEFTDLTLHLIGPLQSNKVSDAVALFDVIETIDRPKIAVALAKEMAKQGKHLPCFIQVNTGAHPLY